MTPFQRKLQSLTKEYSQKKEQNPNTDSSKNRWQNDYAITIQKLIESSYFKLTKDDIQSLKQIPQELYNQLPRKHRECIRALYLILEKEEINHEIL